MLNATEMAEEIQELTAWQETPFQLYAEDYVKIVVRAVRKFFVDINHAEEYSSDNWIVDADSNVLYDRSFLVDEEEYIKLLCQIEFFKRVQTDVNNRFGYSTDALTITNADKPYANLQQTITDLQNERRLYFHKMIRYSLGGS